jgi:hypothetical protein
MNCAILTSLVVSPVPVMSLCTHTGEIANADEETTVSDGNDNGEDMAILPFDDGSTGCIIRRVWHDGAGCSAS